MSTRQTGEDRGKTGSCYSLLTQKMEEAETSKEAPFIDPTGVTKYFFTLAPNHYKLPVTREVFESCKVGRFYRFDFVEEAA